MDDLMQPDLAQSILAEAVAQPRGRAVVQRGILRRPRVGERQQVAIEGARQVAVERLVTQMQRLQQLGVIQHRALKHVARVRVDQEPASRALGVSEDVLDRKVTVDRRDPTVPDAVGDEARGRKAVQHRQVDRGAIDVDILLLKERRGSGLDGAQVAGHLVRRIFSDARVVGHPGGSLLVEAGHRAHHVRQDAPGRLDVIGMHHIEQVA